MTNRGKNICKTLKEIRQKVAEENGIPLNGHECTYEGDCNGTCPHCDAELRYIEGELEKRKADLGACFMVGKQLPRERFPIEDNNDTILILTPPDEDELMGCHPPNPSIAQGTLFRQQ